MAALICAWNSVGLAPSFLPGITPNLYRRKGVGWLVASAAASGAPPPLVLPFVHSGMERVMPKGRALPKLGELAVVAVVRGLASALCELRNGWVMDIHGWAVSCSS